MGPRAGPKVELERQEWQRVLASGIFDRSPSLSQVFIYICEKYFEGTAAEIKEYNIAVDALGRSPEFDQKKDSIVRVQVHRLRERLADYYAKDGASHAIHILIPQGQYVPRFVHPEPVAPEPVVAEPEVMVPAEIAAAAAPEPVVVPLAMVEPRQTRRWTWGALALGVAVIAVAGTIYLRHSPTPAHANVAPAPMGGTDSVRILMGLKAGSYTDGFGRVWMADRFFDGGRVVETRDKLIRGTREQRLYQSFRQGMFRYDIPLNPGVYELRLHFAELHFGENNLAGQGGEGSRAFGVNINGKTVLEHLDVTGEAGASTAHVRVFRDVVPAADGMVHVSFVPEVSVPILNAIEITPGVAGKLEPVRLVMQDRAYTDRNGHVWQPDRYALGGQVVKRDPLDTAEDPDLYAGERFGNLQYLIPVPPGRYTVNLYMAERWIGPDLPGGGGSGSRRFDILLNGVLEVRDFDLFTRAGGAQRAFVQAFHGVEPNHQGYLALSLAPAKNFALLNALEVLDEGR